MKITVRAKEELKGIFALKENENKSIRIVFEGFGWGGPKFGLALDEQTENDIKKNIEGVNVVYEDRFKEFINDVTINYTESVYGKGFVVETGARC